jgi:hypothetical protein
VEDWRVEYFTPDTEDVASALALIALGLGSTLLIDRVGGGSEDDSGES